MVFRRPGGWFPAPAKGGRAVSVSKDWLAALTALDEAGLPHVLVSVIETRGSSPREAGAKMVVAADRVVGSIGGGTLEFDAIAEARAMLDAGGRDPRLRQILLGPDAGQCCGGGVSLLFEPFRPAGRVLAVFGAGHVALALVRALEGVPVRLLWIDERPGIFPNRLPPGTEAVTRPDPVAFVAELPAGAHVLVMTHDHGRDFDLIAALIRRDDLASVGLIGSKTKWARFRHRLAAAGIEDERIARVRCPIGLPGIGGKRPAEIAIAIAAQFLLDTPETA